MSTEKLIFHIFSCFTESTAIQMHNGLVLRDGLLCNIIECLANATSGRYFHFFFSSRQFGGNAEPLIQRDNTLLVSTYVLRSCEIHFEWKKLTFNDSSALMWKKKALRTWSLCKSHTIHTKAETRVGRELSRFNVR